MKKRYPVLRGAAGSICVLRIYEGAAAIFPVNENVRSIDHLPLRPQWMLFEQAAVEFDLGGVAHGLALHVG